MTGKDVYDIALVLINEVTEAGSIAVDTPEEYKTKSVKILSILQTETLSITETPVMLASLDDTLMVSDRTAMLVLPYGLASQLIMSENPNIASFFNDRYEELKRKIIYDPVLFEATFTVEG